MATQPIPILLRHQIYQYRHLDQREPQLDYQGYMSLTQEIAT